MRRELLFHRDFRGYTGGHGKVWDYYNHARSHPDWNVAIHLTPGSSREGNPWLCADPAELRAAWEPARANALFLAGMDWSAYPTDDAARPVVNLVQHVRHADPADPRHAFLGRPAVRLCVSRPVADAILSTGRVNGPVRVIPAGIDHAALPPVPAVRHGVVVAATKRPALGRALAARLSALGYDTALVDTPIARPDFLACLARARVAVLLPDPTEGFYLPALEAMALRCATVVPDCVGNREYVVPDVNALVPEARVEDLVDAVAALDDESRVARLAGAGMATAGRFDLASERAAFHRVLDSLERLWTP